MAGAATPKGGGYSVPPPSTLRAELHAIIERALVLLDELDGDLDLEDGGDAEPSLGWTTAGALGANATARDVDCEGDPADDEPDGNDEPWGAPARLDRYSSRYPITAHL